MIAMKLKGRVMKGASSLPIEFRRALETNTLKSDFMVTSKDLKLNIQYLAKAPRHTATQR